MYIPTSFPDRLGELWWIALEAVIAQNSRIGMVINGKDQYFECAGVREKRELYDAIYRYLRSMKTEEEVRRTVRDLCACYSVDVVSFCRDLCMDWPEIVGLAADPLCTIGAHTVNHMMLRKVPSEAMVRAEMEMSRAVLEAALGKRPQHLAYPVGDPTSAGPREFRIAAELGFKTAVTTRPGVLFKVAPRLSDRAAAYLGQWRIPAATIFESPDVGRGHRILEPVPPRQRGLIFRWRATSFESRCALFGLRPVGSGHPADQRHSRQHPAKSGDDVIDRCDKAIDVGQHRLCKRHRQQAPY